MANSNGPDSADEVAESADEGELADRMVGGEEEGDAWMSAFGAVEREPRTTADEIKDALVKFAEGFGS